MDNDHQISNYDRMYGEYHDAKFLHQKATTIKDVDFFGRSETFIVETVRIPNGGDVVFIENLGPEGHVRLRLPVKVVNTVVRQREALAARVRRVKSKAAMKQRMADGFVPRFAKKNAATQ